MNPKDIRTTHDVVAWLKHDVDWNDIASADVARAAIDVLGRLHMALGARSDRAVRELTRGPRVMTPAERTTRMDGVMAKHERGETTTLDAFLSERQRPDLSRMTMTELLAFMDDAKERVHKACASLAALEPPQPADAVDLWILPPVDPSHFECGPYASAFLTCDEAERTRSEEDEREPVLYIPISTHVRGLKDAVDKVRKELRDQVRA